MINIRTGIRATFATVAAGLLAATLLAPAPVSAAVNDSFSVRTNNGCGVAEFVDYGPGAPGGGNNDDYVMIHDYCRDGHGVSAWVVWRSGGTSDSYGPRYNGSGLAGDPVVWDPFYQANGPDVRGGDRLMLLVCLVDGPNDLVGVTCATSAEHTSADG